MPSHPPTAPVPIPKIHFGFYVPNGAKLPALDVGEVWRQIIGERRALVCEVAPLLIRAGYSQNAVARMFGLAPSALCGWLKLYREGGKPALVPRQGGPRRKQPGPAALNLRLILGS